MRNTDGDASEATATNHNMMNFNDWAHSKVAKLASRGLEARTDSCFLSATLSQYTILVIEDLCRVIPAVSQALFQHVPVVWQMCSP